VGCRPQEFDVSLDTGSSDFWIATNQCTTCTSGISLFDPSASSTFKASTSSANITYGAGSVQGTISQDTVSLGTLTVPKQTLLAATQPTPNLMQYGLSGIMGLAFMPISAMKAYPFWENLVNNELANNVMSFYLERYVDQSTDISTAPGGTFILGGINSSLYTGEIEFLPVPQPTGPTPSYWMLEVSAMTVQGKSITVPDNSLAAIDTGTTLIAAPSATVQSLWATVPGSQPLTGDYEGLYAFPCSTDVSVSISFGGTAWAINTKDMNLGSVDVTTTGPMSGIVDAASSGSQMCVGAIFDIGSSVGSGPGAPSWVIGDTFLKNVYTVLQGGTPLHIGFAHLPSASSLSCGTSHFSLLGGCAIYLSR
ncbi:acid protease, partial [Leucogyrophana mollusca]